MFSTRRETLNNTVLLIVLVFSLKMGSVLPGLQNSIWYIPLSMLTATGFHEFLMRAMFFFVSHSESLKRIYWGKLYLSGYWSYEYTKENKIFFGIWRFEQDLDGIHVIGMGLSENCVPRTIVRSVSPLIEDQGLHWILNIRTELDSPTAPLLPVYSKTTLILDSPKGWGPVVTMRATTEIFGGASTGQLHPDVIFRKHLDARSDEDVIMSLKKKYELKGNS
jgi:hypothetical protein